MEGEGRTFSVYLRQEHSQEPHSQEGEEEDGPQLEVSEVWEGFLAEMEDVLAVGEEVVPVVR